MRVAPAANTFIMALRVSDWDKIRGGWLCSCLTIPGAKIANMYAAGNLLAEASYRVEKESQIIYWKAKSSPPRSTSVLIKLTQALSLETETRRWEEEARQREIETLRLRKETLLLRKITTITAIIGILIAIAGVAVNYLTQQQSRAEQAELNQQKFEIYDALTKKIETREEFVQYLRRVELLLRSQIRPTDLAPTDTYLYGNIMSDDNKGISDAQISIGGGSQAFSNPGGDFLIICRPGQLISIRKEGYQAQSFVLTSEHFEDKTFVALSRKEEP